jgi:hypothetical protein
VHDACALLGAEQRKLLHHFVLLFLYAADQIMASLAAFSGERTQGRYAQVDPHLDVVLYLIRRRRGGCTWALWREFRRRSRDLVIDSLRGPRRQEYTEENSREARHGPMLAPPRARRYAFLCDVSALTALTLICTSPGQEQKTVLNGDLVHARRGETVSACA